MTIQSGIPEVPLAPSGGAAGAPGVPMLVEQSGLSAREHQQSGLVRTVGPLVRSAHAFTSRYFATVLVILIVLAIGFTYKQGGFDLMGQQIRNALVLGAIYALVAIGYTMVYGIIELINFAHGDVFTAAGFFAVTISGLLHLDSLAASSFGGLLLALAIVFPLSMIAAGIVGVVIELVAYRRLRDSPRLAPLITAIGVSFGIEGI